MITTCCKGSVQAYTKLASLLIGPFLTLGKTKMFGCTRFLGVLTFMSVVTPGTSGGLVRCNPGMYYDTAIGRCDVCDVICDYAEIQGTVHECSEKCPEYKTTTTSKPFISTNPSTSSPSGDRHGGFTMSTQASIASLGVIYDQPRLILLLVMALCTVTILMSTVIILLVVWKLRGDTSHRKTIYNKINRAPSPIYANGQKKRINGDYVINGLLARDSVDV
ncbi:uncharacterized protein [Haliotis cracherodii]|uniref:uncharacterized protein n=1 Tax=Haliotis cracherodii TaxID=6455 RepID=UPI0039ECEF4E